MQDGAKPGELPLILPAFQAHPTPAGRGGKPGEGGEWEKGGDASWVFWGSHDEDGGSNPQYVEEEVTLSDRDERRLGKSGSEEKKY